MKRKLSPRALTTWGAVLSHSPPPPAHKAEPPAGALPDEANAPRLHLNWRASKATRRGVRGNVDSLAERGAGSGRYGAGGGVLGDGWWLTASLSGQGHPPAEGQSSKGNPFLISAVRRSQQPGSLAVGFAQNCQTLNPLTARGVRRKLGLSTETPSAEPTCCVYLSRVQMSSSPLLHHPRTHTHTRTRTQAHTHPPS